MHCRMKIEHWVLHWPGETEALTDALLPTGLSAFSPAVPLSGGGPTWQQTHAEVQFLEWASAFSYPENSLEIWAWGSQTHLVANVQPTHTHPEGRTWRLSTVPAMGSVLCFCGDCQATGLAPCQEGCALHCRGSLPSEILYMGGWDQEDLGSRPAWANSSRDPPSPK
jgi:hypothetical protein